MKSTPPKEYGTPAELSQGRSNGHSQPTSSATVHGKDEMAAIDDQGNWVMAWKNCPACLIPLGFISDVLEERRKHMVKCEGGRLDAMFDPICPNKSHCTNKDVEHWANLVH